MPIIITTFALEHMAAKKIKATGSAATSNSAPKRAKQTKTSVNWGEWLYQQRPDESGQTGGWRQLYWALSLAVILLTGFMAVRVGVNGDDRFQVEYSERLVDYFSSFGSNKAVFYEEDEAYTQYVRYYGGAFDLLAGGINRTLGFSPDEPVYHRVRHLVNAAFALLLIFTLAFWARDLGGYRAASLLLLLALGSPRLLGHGVMNPKDIPFAAGYTVAIYFLFRLLRSLPQPRPVDIAGFVLGAALATGQRVGGLLVIAYAGLFMGIDFLFRYGLKGLIDYKQVGRYALYWGGSSLLAFGLALLVWPYAMQSPIKHTLEALEVFSNYSVRISVLFEGDTLFSDAIPRSYPLVWMGITIALPVLAGIAAALLLSFRLAAQFSPAAVSLLWFAAIFPLAYLTYKDSALYDGWRQLLFVYPSLLLLAALGWESLLRYKAAWQWGFAGLLLLLQTDAMAFSVRYPGYAYVYFNPLQGGVKGAHGYYETDYWGVSTREAVRWMEKQGVLHAGMDSLTIATNFPYNLKWELGSDYKDKVKVQYVRFNARYAEEWKYGIFTNRFIRGPQLRAGKWPNSKAVHVVEAGGAPLTVIEKNQTNDAYMGEKAMKENRLEIALPYFESEVTLHPDNELAWMNIASIYANTAQPDEAMKATETALTLAPENETALYMKGHIYLMKADLRNSEESFQHLVRVNPENSTAYFYLAEISRQNKNNRQALRYLEKALTYNPQLKNAYIMASQIYEAEGDFENAAKYKQYAEQF